MSASAFLIAAERRGAAVTYDSRMGVWELTDDYHFDTSYGRFTAFAGFRFDLASIPRAFWRIMAPYELSIEGPLLHDLLYRRGGRLARREYGGEMLFTRADADRLFLDEMRKQGIAWWRRRAAYVAVRMFGGNSWKGE